MQKANKQVTGKIVLTGGHAATAALATIQALSGSVRTQKIYWIGSKWAVEGKKALTLEFKTFPGYGIKCINLVTGKLHRRWSSFAILSILKVPLGFLHALVLLVLIRPKVVVSFGGFAALPVVVMAWVLRVPVIIHEQTTGVGLANKLSSPFAKRIAIARMESVKYFPKGKTVLTGNPVSSDFFEIEPKKEMSVPPVILATGGSRGSQIFNQAIFDALNVLVGDYRLIHQCGELDLPKANKIRRGLPVKDRKKYDIYSSIPPNQMPDYFAQADIILGRAGANTVAEVMASRRPAIFVPIPWTQNDEQTKNAVMAVEAGLAIVIRQDDLTAGKLIESIKEVEKRWKDMRLKDEKIRTLDKEAAAALSDLALDIAR